MDEYLPLVDYSDDTVSKDFIFSHLLLYSTWGHPLTTIVHMPRHFVPVLLCLKRV
jgi:hypothetical protein